MRSYACALLLALLLPVAALAADPPSSDAAAAAAARDVALLKSLDPIHGSVKVPSAKAGLDLGDRYYFLGATDSKKVIEDGWRNPKGSADDVLGMVFPSGQTPLDDPGWGAVITWRPTGYVSDKDARTTNYDDILKQLREGQDEDNKQRKKDGSPELNLVGWAQPPTYDQAAHSLIWARDLETPGVKEHTLNYDMRVLGRSGVLSVNVVAGMNQLAEVRTAAEALRKAASFEQGSRYADFKPETDKRAAYGIGGLILGGAGLLVAKKAGLLAVALIFLKKGFVVIAAAVAGAWAWLRRVLGGKKAE